MQKHIIIEVDDDGEFRFYHHYHEACFPHWKEGEIYKVESITERRKCWGCLEWIEATCECGMPLGLGHECSLGYWDGRQYLTGWDNLIRPTAYEREA